MARITGIGGVFFKSRNDKAALDVASVDTQVLHHRFSVEGIARERNHAARVGGVPHSVLRNAITAPLSSVKASSRTHALQRRETLTVPYPSL